MKAFAALRCLLLVPLLSACAVTWTPGDAPSDPLALRCGGYADCVDSQEMAAGLPGLRFNGPAGLAQRHLVATLASFPEARVVQVDPRRVKAIFIMRSGREDEVEFAIHEASGRIEFRARLSAGTADAPRNRLRMQEFAARFASRAPA